MLIPVGCHDDVDVGSDDVTGLVGLGEGLDAIASYRIVSFLYPRIQDVTTIQCPKNHAVCTFRKIYGLDCPSSWHKDFS